VFKRVSCSIFLTIPYARRLPESRGTRPHPCSSAWTAIARVFLIAGRRKKLIKLSRCPPVVRPEEVIKTESRQRDAESGASTTRASSPRP
jgi:hypothetical protein